MPDLATALATARSAGYSDKDIADHLAADPSMGPKVAAARQQGYGDADIVAHLSTPAATAKTPPTPSIAAPAETAWNSFLKLPVVSDWAGGLQKFAQGVEDDKAAFDQRGSKMPANPIEAAKDTFAAQGRMIGHVGDAVNAAFAPVNNFLQRSVAEPYGAAMSTVLPGTDKAQFANGMMTALSAAGPEVGPTRMAKVPFGPAAPRLATVAVTPEALQTAKNAAYAAADAAGVRYTPQAFSGLVSSMTQDVMAANLNPARHPKAASMLQEIQEMQGQAPSLTQLDQLRQVVRRDVANSRDDAEAFFGRKMIGQIDQFIDAAGPQDVAAGSATDAARLIKNARDLNTRVRKTEAVTDAVESAKLRAGSTGSGGNADNATRQNIRGVLEKTPNLTDAEDAAMRGIALGSPGQNALRQIGKLSPQGNNLMAALNLGSAAAGGVMGAIPGAAGIVAKLVADGMTKSKVDALLQLIATDGAPAEQLMAAQRELGQVTSPAAIPLRRLIDSKLLKWGGATARGTVAADTLTGDTRSDPFQSR